jgi:hypothetical protein
MFLKLVGITAVSENRVAAAGMGEAAAGSIILDWRAYACSNADNLLTADPILSAGGVLSHLPVSKQSEPLSACTCVYGLGLIVTRAHAAC